MDSSGIRFGILGAIICMVVAFGVSKLIPSAVAEVRTFCVVVQEQNGIIICHYPGINKTEFYKCDNPVEEEYGMSCTKRVRSVNVKQGFVRYVPPKSGTGAEVQ